jgi:hypothetical protein
VTEHREPPRIGHGDRLFDASLEQPSRGFRLRPMIAARNAPQLDSLKVGIVLLTGTAVVIAVLFVGSWAMHSTFDWLAIQAPYQIPFHQIHLVNEPPRWFRGGTRAFLEGVRKSAAEAETISVLRVLPEQLEMSFKKYAWVESVKVSYTYGGIDVSLRYHRPVAWVQVTPTEQIMIDEKANVLSVDDVNVLQLDKVFKVTGKGLSAPSDRRPGVVWKVRDESNLEQVDDRIRAAAKLANFLLQEPQQADAQRSSALRVDKIIVTDFRGRGLFVVTAENVVICWGQAPGDEPIGHSSAAEKWAILRRWEETEKSRSLIEGDYWAFSGDGLRHEGPHSDPRRLPTTRKASENPREPPVPLTKPPASG